ncbi:MAG: LysE family transporter, partial [Candidatus Hadarchaeales archaeon]
ETSPLVLGSNPLVGGVLLSSVLNPTVPLWWVGIGFPNLLAAYQLGSLLGLAFWLVGHALSDIVWFGGVSILCARGKKFIGTGFHRALLLGCSTFLLTWGAFLILHVAL